MGRPLGLLGVPSSAGAHWPGQEKAPAALRAAGMVERLRGAQCSVTDYGDLARVRWQPGQATFSPGTPHSVEAVRAVALATADGVRRIVAAGETPLVLGGDCTVTVGAVSGYLHERDDLALVYIDGGVDLYTPETNPTGIMDSMGVAHMLGVAGTSEELSRLGPREPLLRPEQVVLFGYGTEGYGSEEAWRESPEWKTLESYALSHVPANRVRGRAVAAASAALAEVERRADRFLVHFDVDVIEFFDAPLADVPLFNSGLAYADALASLATFAASPKFGGLVITELNPDHADEEGTLVATFAQDVASALGRAA